MNDLIQRFNEIIIFIEDCNPIAKTIIVLLCFMIIDIITGVILAIKEKKVNSKIGKIGALIKLGMIVSLAFAYFVDLLYGTNGAIFKTFATILVAFEGTSIIENFGNLGIPGMKYLSSVFERINPENKNNDEEGE